MSESEGGAAGEAGGFAAMRERGGGRRPGPVEGKRGRNPGRLPAAEHRGRHLGREPGLGAEPAALRSPGEPLRRPGRERGAGTMRPPRPFVAVPPGGREGERGLEWESGMRASLWCARRAGREAALRRGAGTVRAGRRLEALIGLLPAGLQGGSHCGPSMLALRPVTGRAPQGRG